MDREERIDHVFNQLNGFLDRIRQEYDLTYAEMIGMLEMCKLDIWHESAHEEGD